MPRPIGVWLLLAVSIAVAVYTIERISPGLRHPPPHGWNEKSAWLTPYSVSILVLLILSAAGTWYGSRIARALYLLSLAFMVYGYIDTDYPTIAFVMDYSGQHPGYMSPVQLAFSTTLLALRAPVWMLLNLWYFLGGRTRVFFSGRGTAA